LSKKEAKKAITASYKRMGRGSPEKDHIKKACKKYDNGDKRFS